MLQCFPRLLRRPILLRFMFHVLMFRYAGSLYFGSLFPSCCGGGTFRSPLRRSLPSLPQSNFTFSPTRRYFSYTVYFHSLPHCRSPPSHLPFQATFSCQIAAFHLMFLYPGHAVVTAPRLPNSHASFSLIVSISHSHAPLKVHIATLLPPALLSLFMLQLPLPCPPVPH